MPNDPKQYQFDLPETERPAWFPLNEPYVPNHEWYNSHRSSDRIYDTIEGVRAVIIHATAGHRTSDALDAWTTKDASAHWIVPDEDEEAHGNHIWSVVREARAARHVRNSSSHPDVWGGRNRINHWSVGIEIVNLSTPSVKSDPFSDWQLLMSALIVRRCWARYPNLRHVVSHAKVQPATRSDPGAEFPWDRFQALCLTSANDPTPAVLSALPPLTPGLKANAEGCCM